MACGTLMESHLVLERKKRLWSILVKQHRLFWSNSNGHFNERQLCDEETLKAVQPKAFVDRLVINSQTSLGQRLRG